MTIDQLETYYGTQEKAAKAIGCTSQAISQWRKKVRIPTDYQIKWELESKGALRADLPQEIRAA